MKYCRSLSDKIITKKSRIFKSPNHIITKIVVTIMTAAILACIIPLCSVSAVSMISYISIDDVTVTEGFIASFTVTLSQSSTDTVTVDYTTSNDTAQSGSDYSSTSGTITFSPGETTKTLDVTTLEDSIDEYNEAFFVDLSNPTYASIDDEQGVGTILDNDAAPTISINDDTASEGNIASFYISLSSSSEKTITVNYITSGGTATADVDYTAVHVPQTITFAPTELLKTIDVQTLEDSTNEYNETFNVNLSNAANATISDGIGACTILDNDPVPSISINDVSVTEGGTAVFTISLSNASERTVMVNYATSDNTASSGSDYTVNASTVTFDPGETTKNIAVSTYDDSIGEDTETFYMNLSNAVNASISDDIGVGTILDNDPNPLISINDTSTSEGHIAAFTISLSSPSSKTVTVNYATSDNTATSDSDYTVNAGTVTFNPGETTKNIAVSTYNDSIGEDTETFYMNLSNAVNASISDDIGVGTILDNDPNPLISINDTSTSEGHIAAFTISLSSPSSKTVTVNYATSDNTASSGSDYTVNAGTVTFNPGETTKNVSVQTINDTLDESDETFYVNLSSPVNATINDSQGVGTILDDDDSPTISVSGETVDEAAGTLTYTITLSFETGNDVEFQYSTSDSTATAGEDYVSKSGHATITAGDTEIEITIPISDDTLDEDPESFDLDISNATNTDNTTASGTGTITDNDELPSISINDAPPVFEGNVVTFTVTLSSTSGRSVQVSYTTADNTATAGSDYIFSSGTLTFNPGETSKNISVQTTQDTVYEGDETFFANLSNPINALISDSQGLGTILEDDPAVYTITYDANGGSGAAAQTDDAGETITLHDGAGFTKSAYVIDGWTNTAGAAAMDYMLADLYTINSNKTLYAFWAQDTDEDGVSDEDEIAAGTSPNNANDVPKNITVKIIILDENGNPISGDTIVVNSTPQTKTTASNGSAIFYGVSASPHTLSLRRNNQQLGTYTLYFARSSANNTTITDDASDDSQGSVSTAVAGNFQSLELTVQLNSQGQWQLMNSRVSYRADNPITGDDTNSMLWWYVSSFMVIAAGVYYLLRKRRV